MAKLGKHVPFRMGVFVSFGREGPGDANIQVHLRTTCVLNVSVSPFRQCPKINVTSEVPTVGILCSSKEDALNGEAHLDHGYFSF